MELDELHSLLALTTFPYLGPLKIKLLVEVLGSAKQALEAKKADLASMPGLGSRVLDNWDAHKSKQPWWKEVELAERLQVDLIPWTSALYPKRLLDIIDSPVLLYVRGKITSADNQAMAIVGTRHASTYGLDAAYTFSRTLARQGFTIVSGLARGIDTSAHSAALETGRTLAVIGSGLANIYPRENVQLAERIVQQGALISEFPLTTPPDRQNFPQRNRIVSGLSLGVLLIEAPLQSGAMITMDRAMKQHRRMFTLPGRIDNENFRGNHALIKEGKAQLVESPQDIIDHFQSLLSLNSGKKTQMLEVIDFEREELEVLQALPAEEVSLEEIFQRTQLPAAKLNVVLMSLMLKKAIREYPGKIYKKVLYQHG